MTRMKVTIEADDLLKDLDRLGVDVQAVLDTALAAGAELVQREANRLAPAPHVERSGVKKRGFSAEVDVGPDDEHWYYRFFETGATPHRISGSPLRMIIGGDVVFARFVSHPGMTASPFLRPALDENADQAADAVGDELKKVIK